MDRSNVCYLISITYTEDAIKQQIPTETRKKVYCNVQSITQTEFFSAGEKGIQPEYKLTVFSPDYSGENTVEFNGRRYGIYRTYMAKDGVIELYLEYKAGL